MIKKFLFRTLIVTVPVAVAVMTVNYRVDPADIFSEGGLERQAAVILLGGNNVAGLSNYDERLFQKEFISRLTERPRTVVLGSSRGMLIDRRNGRDSSLINSCMSGARFEDIMAVYQLYADNNMVPCRLIVELSPYMFNSSYLDVRYKTLIEEYDRIAAAIGSKSSQGIELDINIKYLELISLSYFQNAVRMVGDHRAINVIDTVMDSLDQTRMIKFPDGSIAYSADLQNKGVTVSEIQAAADFGHSESFVSMSEDRKRMFETFVGYLQGLGVEVEIFLAPFPVEVLNKKPVFTEVEAYIRSYASKHDIRVWGSYDGCRYGLSIHDFYDGMHSKKHVSNLILR